ncbi:hypothetical protein [Rhodococcus koreensis]
MAHPPIGAIAHRRDRRQPRPFHWAVLEDLAEAHHRFLYRDRRQGNAEVRAFIAARDAATKVGIPDQLAVYHIANRIIRERDTHALR